MASTIDEIFQGMFESKTKQAADKQALEINPALAMAQMVGKPGAFAAFYGNQRNQAMANYGGNITDRLSGGAYSSGERTTPDQLNNIGMQKISKLMQSGAGDTEEGQAQILQMARAIDPQAAMSLAIKFNENNKAKATTETSSAQQMAQRSSAAQFAKQHNRPDLIAPIMTGVYGNDLKAVFDDIREGTGKEADTDLMKDFTSESVTNYLSSGDITDLVKAVDDPSATNTSKLVTEAWGYDPETPEHRSQMRNLINAQTAAERGDATPVEEVGILNQSLKDIPFYDDAISNIADLEQAMQGFELMDKGVTNARTGTLRNLISVYNGSQRAQAEIDAWVTERNFGQRFNDWIQTGISGDTSSETMRELKALINSNLINARQEINSAHSSMTSLYGDLVSRDSINRVITSQRILAGLDQQSSETQTIVDRVLGQGDYTRDDNFRFYNVGAK